MSNRRRSIRFARTQRRDTARIVPLRKVMRNNERIRFEALPKAPRLPQNCAIFESKSFGFPKVKDMLNSR